MEHTTYASRLRYLDADDVDDAVVDYDGLDVEGPTGDKLGDVDGFIVDTQAARLYYVVVDSGGWFSSKRFLLPVGHARLDLDRKRMVVDVTRDALSRYPEYDADRFRELSDEDLRQFESRMVSACCPGEPTDDVSVRSWAYDTRRHYAQPDWWNRAYTSPRTAGASVVSPAAAPPVRDMANREHVVARDRDHDQSPHFDGRAQPGDVLGIETGGERTKIGDTADDENDRRREAERKTQN